jgi:secreted PhoX family phosphatase
VFVLAGDPRSAEAAKRGNIKGDAFGSPDGLWIDGRGVLWIQTDISTERHQHRRLREHRQQHDAGRGPVDGRDQALPDRPARLRADGRPRHADGRNLFVSIQHPGEPGSGDNNPANPGAISTWPDGPGIGRPRSATIVIRRNDGGIVGS